MTTTETKVQSPAGSPSGGPRLEGPLKEESESFGTWLRRQRELREITLREIADTSKISLRYLQALEDDRFDLLPAPVFAKGFLRQYARYVGLDPEETVNFFLSAVEESQEDSNELEISPRRPRSFSTWSYALSALAVAILLMIVVWMLLRLNRDSGQPPPDPGSEAATDTRTSGNAAAPDAAAPAAEAQTATTPAATTPAATTPAAVSPTVAPPPSEVEAEAVDSAVAAPSALFVALDFRDNCWVRATVDGEVKADRVYTQGESLQLWGENQVDLELGNAPAVDLEVDGRALKLDKTSQNPVRRLSIDRETAAALLRSQS